jgi:hypothetical protein
VNQIHADRGEVERKVQPQVAKWRALVETAVVSDGRQLLNEMLEGPLRFTPEGRTYRFVGPLTTGRLIAGMVFPPSVASQTVPSWNQIAGFLESMRTLQAALGPAA